MGTHRDASLETAMRQVDLAWEVRDYLKTHPETAGVFYCFQTEQVKSLFSKMAKHFPGGRLVNRDV